jgi:hypothetical protein
MPAISVFFPTSSGNLRATGADFATQHNKAIADWIYSFAMQGYIGRFWDIVFLYSIDRAFFVFNTATLPDNAVVLSATLDLYLDHLYVDDPFTIVLRQDATKVCPHVPLVKADYDHTLYAGASGSLSSVGMAEFNWYSIDITDLSWINLIGTTKIMAICQEDLDIIAPTGYSAFGIQALNHIRLTVTYIHPPILTTNPATNIVSNSAQLNGDLTDHGESLPVTTWFEYGLTALYGSSTVPEITVVGAFNKVVIGLLPLTTYHFIAKAQNAAGISFGADRIFITPAAPTSIQHKSYPLSRMEIVSPPSPI